MFVILGVLSLIYTLGNSLLSILILWKGGPEIENGVYCLWNHGFIREITKEEYDYLRIFYTIRHDFLFFDIKK